MSPLRIDFFVADFAVSTTSSEFWLCDEEGSPAYIHQMGKNNHAKVILVTNAKRQTIHFHPIDRCVQIPEGKKSCDCMLECNRVIHFIELKDRSEHKREWVSHALSQIASSIYYFKQQPESTHFKLSTCYIANRKRFSQSYHNQLQDFKKQLYETIGYSPPVKLVQFRQKPIVI